LERLRRILPGGCGAGGWVSPSVVGPLYAERILAVNARYLKGPLVSDSPLFVRHLERYPLGTKYGEIVASVRSLLCREPFRRRLRRTSLLADKAGVGAAVVDSFYQKGVYPIPISIHGGSAVTYGSTWIAGFRTAFATRYVSAHTSGTSPSFGYTSSQPLDASSSGASPPTTFAPCTARSSTAGSPHARSTTSTRRFTRPSRTP